MGRKTKAQLAYEVRDLNELLESERETRIATLENSLIKSGSRISAYHDRSAAYRTDLEATSAALETAQNRLGEEKAARRMAEQQVEAAASSVKRSETKAASAIELLRVLRKKCRVRRVNDEPRLLLTFSGGDAEKSIRVRDKIAIALGAGA